MLQNTLIKLPDDLIAHAKQHADTHQTTLTALVIEHLESITKHKTDDILVLFSRGQITKEKAIEQLGFRDYAELLVALGNADLQLFVLPKEELEKQANLLVELLNSSS